MQLSFINYGFIKQRLDYQFWEKPENRPHIAAFHNMIQPVGTT